MVEPIIEIKNLAKRFGHITALHNLSFTVNRGDVFGFLGPNGAGKSTTIRTMLSLIKADSGTVNLFGKALAENRSAILAKTGSIIEKPDFYGYLSAYRNLDITSRISGKSSTKKQILEMLEFVGLQGREKDKVAGFSHGMRQRLGIAQTLLHDPELIILDEPTTGLDPQGIIDIRNLILRLKNEQNKTILLSSHNLSEIELIANRMVIINKGKSVIEGEVNELLRGDELLVTISVNKPEQARNTILSYMPGIQLKQEGEQFQLTLTKNQVIELNKRLVDDDAGVYAMESKRKLEDYFIKILSV